MLVYRDLQLEYDVALERLPANLRSAFVALDPDASMRDWIDASLAHPDPLGSILARNLASMFISFYDANGLTNVGRDRLLSVAQWRAVLGRAGGRLLDVGAGDGEVTREIAAQFSEVVTTELSRPLAGRLRAKGYCCHEIDLATAPAAHLGSFDLVAMQNLIDRTSYPLRLLDRVRHLLTDDGRVVVAVPIPVRPVVFIGPSRYGPVERLPASAPDFESAAAELDAKLFEPLGYRVITLTRAPYLSRGGACSPVRILDDAIFVLERAHQPAALVRK